MRTAIDETKTGTAECEHGVIYQLGRHRLAVGDARDAVLVGQLLDPMPQRTVLLGDAPYCSGGRNESRRVQRGTWGNLVNDQLTTRGYQNLVRDSLQAASPTIAYFFNSWLMLTPLTEAIEKSNMILNNQLVWDKMHAGMGRAPWRQQVEYIIRAVSPQFKTPEIIPGQPARGNVLRHKRAQGSNKYHPTPKPVSLYREMVEAEAACAGTKGLCIYDPFLGGGSSLIACEDLGVPLVGIDIDPRFVEIAVNRWQDHTGLIAEEHKL